MNKLLILLSVSTFLLSGCGGPSPEASADYNLAMRFIKGVGVTQDKGKGYDLLKHAVDEGSPEAELAYGFFLMKGEGVAKDPVAGLKLFERAAESGNVDGQYNAGLAYIRGEATTPDYRRAYKWFEAAALQGDPGSQYNLAVMLLNGEGVSKNALRAYGWFTVAGQSGYPGAVEGKRSAEALLTEDEKAKTEETVAALEKKIHVPSAPAPAGGSEAPAAAGGAGDIPTVEVKL